jgi:uncharacterized small protein (DUF1192 family)
LPRSLPHDGKALVSVDFHTPRPSGAHRKGTSPLEAKIETLQAEIARLEAEAASQRADLERARPRRMAELLKATAEILAASGSRSQGV